MSSGFCFNSATVLVALKSEFHVKLGCDLCNTCAVWCCAMSCLCVGKASFHLPLLKEHALFSTSARDDVNVTLKCKYLLKEMSRTFLSKIINTEIILNVCRWSV